MRLKNFIYLTTLALVGLFFAACGDTGQGGEGGDTETPAADTATMTSAVSLTDFSDSPAFPDAQLSMDYKNGKFTFNVKSDTYKLEEQTSDAPQKMCANSKDGQHIHLIVDNEPYEALYKPEHEKSLTDGEHYVLSFLSRSYHESIKTPEAHVAVKAEVKSNGFASSEPVSSPMLFYSRPKGKYVGNAETDKVMLDFYLSNVTLSPDGFKVVATVNGDTEFTLTEWKPYFLEGLPMGDNKVKLTLVDKDGNVVATPLNPVERVFTLVDDPAPGQ